MIPRLIMVAIYFFVARLFNMLGGLLAKLFPSTVPETSGEASFTPGRSESSPSAYGSPDHAPFTSLRHSSAGEYVCYSDVPESVCRRLRYSMVSDHTDRRPVGTPLWKKLSISSERGSIGSTIGVELSDALRARPEPIPSVASAIVYHNKTDTSHQSIMEVSLARARELEARRRREVDGIEESFLPTLSEQQTVPAPLNRPTIPMPSLSRADQVAMNRLKRREIFWDCSVTKRLSTIMMGEVDIPESPKAPPLPDSGIPSGSLVVTGNIFAIGRESTGRRRR